MDSNTSPLWKFGLKEDPLDQTGPPSYGYIYGRESSVGMVSTENNQIFMSDTVGMYVQNDNHYILRAGTTQGVFIDQKSTVNPALTIQSSPLSASDMQVWEDASSNALSVVDELGRFGILNDDPDYDLDVTGSGRLESIYLTSGIYFQDGTFQSSAFTGTDASAVSGWAAQTITNGDNAVSGWAASTFLTSDDSTRTYNNITADFSMSDTSDVVFMDTSSGPVNVYLPTAVGQGGKEIMIKYKAGSNSGVLIGSGSQTIDGQSQFGVYNIYESISLISDNSNWFIS